MEKYLIINGGSSSLKFSLYSMPDEEVLVSGYFEKIGLEDSFWTIKINGEKIKKHGYLKNHADAVNVMLKELIENNIIEDISEIKGVGHRVLHGGEIYNSSVIIDDKVLEDITNLTKLGPLHHPGEIAGIKAMQKCIPNIPQIAVFDTVFHQTIPKENYTYPVPYTWYEKYGVRKYGFHGTSHQYITQVMQKLLKKEKVNLIVCHIGSGVSISAIKDGKCYNTTMGLTPLDGLMMGTRSGSIDPSIVQYIMKNAKLSAEEVNNILNNESGFLGITGKSDMRDVEEMARNGNEKAILALGMYDNSVVRYIGQYYFELEGKIDAIVFTAGIGENSIEFRKHIVQKLSEPLDIKLDNSKNNGIAGYKVDIEGVITTPDSKIPIYVIPTNEEIMILRDTYKLCHEKND